MTDEQVARFCSTITDAAEHVFGPYKESESLVQGVHRIADALSRIADALGEDGELGRIARNLEDINGNVERVVEALDEKET